MTSALLYREVVRMQDDTVPAWAGKPKNRLLILMPIAKFGMGCVRCVSIYTAARSQDLGDACC